MRTAVRLLACIALGAPLPAAAAAQSSARDPAERSAVRRDGARDFDAHVGTWKTLVRRLVRPLSGSTEWAEYEGTTVVRPVMDGAANLAELDVTGPAGRIEGMSLRLYDPAARQWTLHYATRRGGTLFPPVVGEFRDGHIGLRRVDHGFLAGLRLVPREAERLSRR